MNQSPLRLKWALVLILAGGIARAADLATLPLNPGTYVLASYPRCEEAPLAAVVRFDGRSLAGPHDSNCRTEILERDGSTFRIRRGCRADGASQPSIPDEFVETVQVKSRTAIVLTPASGEPQNYALCPGFR